MKFTKIEKKMYIMPKVIVCKIVHQESLLQSSLNNGFINMRDEDKIYYV